jgi:hypothetical protein
LENVGSEKLIADAAVLPIHLEDVANPPTMMQRHEQSRAWSFESYSSVRGVEIDGRGRVLHGGMLGM